LGQLRPECTPSPDARTFASGSPSRRSARRRFGGYTVEFAPVIAFCPPANFGDVFTRKRCRGPLPSRSPEHAPNREGLGNLPQCRPHHSRRVPLPESVDAPRVLADLPRWSACVQLVEGRRAMSHPPWWSTYSWGPPLRTVMSVRPALPAVVADIAHPTWRGRAVGVYRVWRDLGVPSACSSVALSPTLSAWPQGYGPLPPPRCFPPCRRGPDVQDAPTGRPLTHNEQGRP